MEKFKGKNTYKNRVRIQTIKNLIIKVEKLRNKHGRHIPIKHRYYFKDTEEFTLSKPEQKIFKEHMKSLGYKVKVNRREKLIVIYPRTTSELYANYEDLIDKIND